MKMPRHIARRVNDFLSRRVGIRVVRARQLQKERSELQRFDEWHERKALQAVSAIEKYNGQKLSPHSKKLADDYAVQILGGIEYAPWLYVYTLVSGKFKEGWIPDNFFGKFVVKKANKNLGPLTKLKTFTNIVLKSESLPDIAYYIDGVFYCRDLVAIDINSLRRIIENSYCDVFVKKDGSEGGDGVIKMAANDIKAGAFNNIGNCVIQAPIQQHKFFDRIISGSVATVRITTVKDDHGKTDLRASYLRVGRAGTSWLQVANLVRIAIIDRHGTLDTFGYTPEWRRWSAHPDTNFSFSKQRVPQFKKAMETCIKLHASVPHFTIIGWDVAIGDDNNIKLIEWNGEHCDIKFSEAATGPCFKGLNWEQLGRS